MKKLKTKFIAGTLSLASLFSLCSCTNLKSYDDSSIIITSGVNEFSYKYLSNVKIWTYIDEYGYINTDFVYVMYGIDENKNTGELCSLIEITDFRTNEVIVEQFSVDDLNYNEALRIAKEKYESQKGVIITSESFLIKAHELLGPKDVYTKEELEKVMKEVAKENSTITYNDNDLENSKKLIK